jgi:predicted nuclease with TOPRIM domain
MDNIVDFPGRKSGGGGPEDPMLEQRVAQVEDDIKAIKESLLRLEMAVSTLTEELKELRKQTYDLALRVASMEGQLKHVPTSLQLLVAVIATWASGAAIVLGLMRVMQP